MWKHICSVLNPKRTNGTESTLRLLGHNNSITESSSVAETLNQRFCSIGVILTDKMPKFKKSFKIDLISLSKSFFQ